MAQSTNQAQVGAKEFFQKTVDSLLSHIAILDGDGTIIAVNATWDRFARGNGLEDDFCVSRANYLRTCDKATGPCSEEAHQVSDGIRDVLARRRDHFYLEYPCHSPTERRWFSVRITRFEIGGLTRVVVTHDSITQRVLAEIQVGEVIRQLELQASTDGLTGIANRRTFDRTFGDEWKRHDRSRTPLSVALIDVDCFKLYNDRQGHLAGDECLTRVAQAIASRMSRPGDFAARYGGEEFAVILPDTGEEGADAVLQGIIDAVRDLAIPHPASLVDRRAVTVSIGSATTTPGHDETPSCLLDRADKALYEAKSRGRDRLASAASPVPARG